MELAKAYVQIIPSANGIKGSISEVLGGEADSAGSKAGTSIASKIKNTIVAAGIGKVIQMTVSEGAKLEQSIGGIETLFKKSSDTMKKYADVAYKTAGISANSYMEQATSFSASLLNSLGGDTKKAAESANQAIIDMADNSNKMGTNIQDIQNAYQGFAKQNYTMLDNLKLGYGGTKTEMQRLLKDAQKLTGVKYDINNLADVYSAIHAIQKNLDITGTTSKEAATTVSGSLASMQASFTNLLGNMALGKNIVPSLQSLVKTSGTFLFGNLLPMVGNIVKQIPAIITTLGPQLIAKGTDMMLSLSQGLVNGIPQFLSTALPMVQKFANQLAKQAPVFIDKGFEMLNNLVDGIIKGIPILISQLPQIITTFANTINNNAPVILQKGFELIVKLVKGIINAIPVIISNLPKIIEAIVSTIMAFNWLNLGKNIIKFLGNGISSMIGFVKGLGNKTFNTIINTLKSLPSKLFNLGKTAFNTLGRAIKGAGGGIRGAVKLIFNTVINNLRDLPAKALSIGTNIVQGLWNGIKGMGSWIGNKIKGFGDSVLSSLKDFFGIHSPSKVFENEIGKMLVLGMSRGIENNLNPVRNAMRELGDETFGMINTDFSISTEGMESDNTRLTSAINRLDRNLLGISGSGVTINGITYDDGSNVSNAVNELLRALKIERRT